jgi:hypothetical protein
VLGADSEWCRRSISRTALSIVFSTAVAHAFLQKPRAQTAVKVETKVKVSAGGGAAQPSDDDNGAQLTDDSDDGLGDLQSQLRKLQGKRLTIPNYERASLENAIRRLSSLIDAIEDMDHDERLDAIQAEKRLMQIMERINAIGSCPVGWTWKWKPELNLFQCDAGCIATADQVKLSEADKRFLAQYQKN